MHRFHTIFVLLACCALLATAWSFSDVLNSIEKMFGKQEQSSAFLDVTGNDEQTARTDADVTVQGRIIMAPKRRRISLCAEGQQLDRRGKCRTVW